MKKNTVQEICSRGEAAEAGDRSPEGFRRGTCYLIGAGDFGDGKPEAEAGDLVIAADGGYAACRERNIRVDVVVGDFDSLGEAPAGEGLQVMRLPVEKDDTDMRAAFLEGFRKGYRRFVVYGGTGGRRISHTIANIQLLAEMAESGAEGRMEGCGQSFFVIRNGEIRFPRSASGDISVFSLSDVSRGVTISGLKYSLRDAELSNRFPLGVSNSFAGGESEITVRQGCLLVIVERENPGSTLTAISRCGIF